MVTTGQHDVGSTTEMSKNLAAKIKNAKYIEIKDGKHLCNIECAQKFNKTIEYYLFWVWNIISYYYIRDAWNLRLKYKQN